MEVIKSIPAVWDETVVLAESRIGELSIFARRKGTLWMLAVMSAAGPEKKIQVPLAFLGDGAYQASLVRDHKENDAAVVVEKLHGAPQRYAEDRFAQRRRIGREVHQAMNAGYGS